MNKLNLNPVYILGIFVIATIIFSWYQHQNKEASKAPIAVATSTQPSILDEEGQQYAKVSQNCALYYENAGTGKDSFSMELSDYTNLHPLSDFLCGTYSQTAKMTLSDGKTLYFVNIAPFDCGSGGCTYYPLLEEKKGLVRHLRGFAGQDTDGTVFGFLSVDPAKHSMSVYDKIGQCGTTNTYTFTATDTPTLVSSSDSCLP
ncbi:MAG: hypothetical protein ACYC48_00035 [Minisyncoccota bacterium]